MIPTAMHQEDLFVKELHQELERMFGRHLRAIDLQIASNIYNSYKFQGSFADAVEKALVNRIGNCSDFCESEIED